MSLYFITTGCLVTQAPRQSCNIFVFFAKLCALFAEEEASVSQIHHLYHINHTTAICNVIFRFLYKLPFQ